MLTPSHRFTLVCVVIMELVKPINMRFSHPARILVCGPSNSGKTTLVTNIIRNWRTFFHHPVTCVVWYYGVYQPGYDKLSTMGVELREGLPESIESDFPYTVSSDETQILVLDDLMKQATKDSHVLDIFTKWSHHKNITALMLSQNILWILRATCPWPYSSSKCGISELSNVFYTQVTTRDRYGK